MLSRGGMVCSCDTCNYHARKDIEETVPFLALLLRGNLLLDSATDRQTTPPDELTDRVFVSIQISRELWVLG